MRINFAHLRERAQNGGWINFAVFDARSNSGSDSDNAILLSQLTAQARANSLKIDQSALVYSSGRRVIFYGSPTLVEFLSKSGVPRWTHHMNV
ncbi:hypothetical protein [Burkholderia cepacia]|uniref:hypothetical protein n=1 Tax=Burkholderia cepacia TaxID=292 RepID=UPI001E5CAE0D|nr:hypothetical protein [Burkholderia cepacia]